MGPVGPVGPRVVVDVLVVDVPVVLVVVAVVRVVVEVVPLIGVLTGDAAAWAGTMTELHYWLDPSGREEDGDRQARDRQLKDPSSRGVAVAHRNTPFRVALARRNAN